MSLTRIRAGRSGNYTVVGNRIIRDPNVSLKAKGLFVLVMSLPDDWNLSIDGLTCILKESESAIAATLRELIEHGYCRREQLRSGTGVGFGTASYTFIEDPDSLSPENVSPENVSTQNVSPEDRTQINKDKLIPEPIKKRETKKESVCGAQGDFYTEVAAGLFARMKIAAFPSSEEAEWRAVIAWARANDFTAERVLETYDLLKRQKFRRGRISPKVLETNLPEYETLVKSLRAENNGPDKQNYSRNRYAREERPTAAEIIANRSYYRPGFRPEAHTAWGSTGPLAAEPGLAPAGRADADADPAIVDPAAG
jgi:hypothetical protein